MTPYSRCMSARYSSSKNHLLIFVLFDKDRQTDDVGGGVWGGQLYLAPPSGGPVHVLLRL